MSPKTLPAQCGLIIVRHQLPNERNRRKAMGKERHPVNNEVTSNKSTAYS